MEFKNGMAHLSPQEERDMQVENPLALDEMGLLAMENAVRHGRSDIIQRSADFGERRRDDMADVFSLWTQQKRRDDILATFRGAYHEDEAVRQLSRDLDEWMESGEGESK
ncbi:MAG: hypothetical protein ACR2FM_02105 [Candidatus Saccharimonadales bacterium]